MPGIGNSLADLAQVQVRPGMGGGGGAPSGPSISSAPSGDMSPPPSAGPSPSGPPGPPMGAGGPPPGAPGGPQQALGNVDQPGERQALQLLISGAQAINAAIQSDPSLEFLRNYLEKIYTDVTSHYGIPGAQEALKMAKIQRTQQRASRLGPMA